MKRTFLAMTLTLVLVFSCFPLSTSAAGLDNFKKQTTYNDNFKDIDPNAWYYENVKTAFEFGLVNGNSPTTYNPEGNVTYAETIALAAKIHSIYNNGHANFKTTTPWYKTYEDYAVKHMTFRYMLNPVDNSLITRDMFAYLLHTALPKSAMEDINEVEDYTIPGNNGHNFNDEIYSFYRSGIMGGIDKDGTFSLTYVKRSEVATIIARMLDPSLRLSFTLKMPSGRAPWGAIVSLNFSIDYGKYHYSALILDTQKLKNDLDTNNLSKIPDTMKTLFVDANNHKDSLDYRAKAICGNYSNLQDLKNIYKEMIDKHEIIIEKSREYLTQSSQKESPDIITDTHIVLKAFEEIEGLKVQADKIVVEINTEYSYKK